MKTVHITEAFDGYPHGAKQGSKRHSYAVGDEPEVSNEFADLIIGKGLAREKPAETRATPRHEPAIAATKKDESP